MKSKIAYIASLLLITSGTWAAELRIGVVARGEGTEERIIQAGAVAAAKEQNSKESTHITVEWRVASEASEEIATVREMVAKKVDGIVLVGYEAESLRIAITAQKANGIPVVICGGGGPQSGVTAVVGTDNYACGRRLMEVLANELSNKGLVAIFGGDFPGNPYLGPRVQGAQDKAKEIPDIRIATVTYAPPDPRAVAARMLEVSLARPGLSGWLMVVNWGLPVGSNDQSQPNQKTVTVDPGIDAGIKQLKTGQLQALLVQDFYGWGQQSVLLLSDKTRWPKDPENNFLATNVMLVTRENLDSFLGKLKEQLGNK